MREYVELLKGIVKPLSWFLLAAGIASLSLVAILIIFQVIALVWLAHWVEIDGYSLITMAMLGMRDALSYHPSEEFGYVFESVAAQMRKELLRETASSSGFIYFFYYWFLDSWILVSGYTVGIISFWLGVVGWGITSVEGD